MFGRSKKKKSGAPGQESENEELYPLSLYGSVEIAQLVNRAHNAVLAGKMPEALECYTNAANLARQNIITDLGNPLWKSVLAEVLRGKYSTHLAADQLPQALLCLEERENALRDSNGKISDFAELRLKRAQVHFQAGRTATAHVDAHSSVLVAMSSLDNPHDASTMLPFAQILSEYSATLFQAGDPSLAVGSADLAVEIFGVFADASNADARTRSYNALLMLQAAELSTAIHPAYGQHHLARNAADVIQSMRSSSSLNHPSIVGDISAEEIARLPTFSRSLQLLGLSDLDEQLLRDASPPLITIAHRIEPHASPDIAMTIARAAAEAAATYTDPATRLAWDLNAWFAISIEAQNPAVIEQFATVGPVWCQMLEEVANAIESLGDATSAEDFRHWHQKVESSLQ